MIKYIIDYVYTTDQELYMKNKRALKIVRIIKLFIYVSKNIRLRVKSLKGYLIKSFKQILL